MTLSKRKCSKCGFEDPEPLKDVIKCPICGGKWVDVMYAQAEWKPKYGQCVKIDMKNAKINGMKDLEKKMFEKLQMRDSVKFKKENKL